VYINVYINGYDSNLTECIKMDMTRIFVVWPTCQNAIVELYPCEVSCNILQHTATRCITYCNTLQHVVLHIATHCNTLYYILQHTATRCGALPLCGFFFYMKVDAEFDFDFPDSNSGRHCAANQGRGEEISDEGGDSQ